MIFGQPFTSSNGKTNNLAKRGALLKPFTIPCSLSFLTPRHHSLLLLNCERTAKSKFFIIQIPSVSTEELVLTHYARSVLSPLCFKRVSLLLNSCFSIIGMENHGESSIQRLRSFDSGHFPFYFVLSCYEFYTPERSLSNSLLYSISGPGRCVSGASLSSAVPTFRKRVG